MTDFRIYHYPLFFAQGQDAYELIERADATIGTNQAAAVFERDLVSSYSPDELPEPVEGEPPCLNYRFFHQFTVGDRSYRYAYTTGDGGCFSLDMVVYEF